MHGAASESVHLVWLAALRAGCSADGLRGFVTLAMETGQWVAPSQEVSVD